MINSFRNLIAFILFSLLLTACSGGDGGGAGAASQAIGDVVDTAKEAAEDHFQ